MLFSVDLQIIKIEHCVHMQKEFFPALAFFKLLYESLVLVLLFKFVKKRFKLFQFSFRFQNVINCFSSV